MRQITTERRLDTFGVFRSDSERAEWYANMQALEKAAEQAGVASTEITAETAARWRATGEIAKNAARMAAWAKRRESDQTHQAEALVISTPVS